MTEASPGELVLKAVQALPEAERDRALVWLIDRNAAGWSPSVARAAARGATAPTFGRPGGLEQYASLHGEHQGVLVRFPIDQHARLREWCERHGFAMATVVRGLVDRFLEQAGDLRPAAPETEAAS